MPARVIYTCSWCRRDYPDGYGPGTAIITARSFDGRTTDMHFCQPDCFEQGVMAAGDRYAKRRAIVVPGEKPAARDNVRQLPRRG